MPPVPTWALISAGTAPTALVATSVAAHLMRHSAYDPWTQTMSYLASGGSGRWVMTAGFVVTAVCHVVTSAGLRIVQPVARIDLALAGVCGIVIAAFPVPPGGMAPIHLTAFGIGAGLLAVWPLLTVSREPSALVLRRARVAIGGTLALSVLLAWLVYEARDGGLVGLAERVDAVALTLWPLAMVFVSRRAVRVDAGLDVETSGALTNLFPSRAPVTDIAEPRDRYHDEHGDPNGARRVRRVQDTRHIGRDEAFGG
ncbi:DUF998 domain-containing protein [Skermania sp. ID1734]|uniref:DUF998 domain-containing protein n=1 Tax=Skermania sp. ID1734 TaxID=2597516 RepID=UPI0021051613|nr:DUF998 domain-containing protein [Skermania sp. ID1734]